MSFGFGNPTSSAAGGLFGANKTTSTGFTLSTPSAPASGNLFGTTTFGSTPSSQPGTGLFGQTTGLSFGTPVASVAPTTQATGLTFGATPTPGSTFGATAATPGTGLSFGTTSAAPTFGAASTSGATGLTFGATSTAGTTGLAFGSPATTTGTGISFGTPAGQTGGLSFGSPATGAQTGSLGFGSPATGAQTGSLGFGSPATGAQTGSLGFGTPSTGTNFAFGNTVTSTAASSGIKFNLPTTSTLLTGLPFGTTTTTAQAGLAFGTQVTTQSGLTFGTPATTTQAGLSFGTPTTSIAAGTTTAAVTPGFQGLGASSTATTKPLTFGTPSTGFSLGAPTATTTSQVPTFGLSSGGGLFGQGLTKPLLGATTSGPTLGLGLGVGLSTTTTAATTTTSSKGLGGVDATQSKPGLTGASPGRTDTNAVKENLIPNEIVQTIESFKSFVKTQKSHSSDIARGSAKPLHKVQEDTEALKQLLAGLTSGLQKNGMLSDKLKSDTAKCLHHAELAQRTHETPAGLQYDNLAPLEFFMELVSGFETDLRVLRQELENTEKHILSLSQSSVLTPQELTLAMRRLHDSFVALAGRLHTVHNSVELQKEQYLNLRKYFLKDTTNVFEETEKKSAMSSTAVSIIVEKNAPGPTPFSGLGSQHGFGMLPSSSKETNSSFTSGNPLGK